MAKLTVENEMPTVQVTEKQQLISHLSSQSYWDSLEARKLFRAQDEDEDLLVTINQKIEKLQSVNQQMDGYENVIKG